VSRDNALLLKVGVALMALAVALVIAAVVVSVVLRGEPERVVAAEVAATSSPEEPQRNSSEEALPQHDDSSSYGAAEQREEKVEEPQPVVQQEAEAPSEAPSSLKSKPDPIPTPQPKPEPEPEPEPRAEPTREPEPQPEEQLLPGAEEDGWPEPTQEELQSANSPRHYELLPGAIMSLSIESIGIYDAPVFDSDGYWALVNGIAHVPETSLPWSPTPQRNVYLAGHRMGYRGTWSRMIFYNLDELGAGDRVVLKDRSGNSYEYEVSEVFLADPDDSWVMGQVRGRDMVTLQTCTPIPTFEKRLIVRADRI
jgi:sortase A